MWFLATPGLGFAWDINDKGPGGSETQRNLWATCLGDELQLHPLPPSHQDANFQGNTSYYPHFNICEKCIRLLSFPIGEFGINYLTSETHNKGLSHTNEESLHQNPPTRVLSSSDATYNNDRMELWMWWTVTQKRWWGSCPQAVTKVEDDLDHFSSCSLQ